MGCRVNTLGEFVIYAIEDGGADIWNRVHLRLLQHPHLLLLPPLLSIADLRRLL